MRFLKAVLQIEAGRRGEKKIKRRRQKIKGMRMNRRNNLKIRKKKTRRRWRKIKGSGKG